ncbi:MAG: sugar phosphate isomerase/epimerase family protein [Thermoguttaceae bacterium]
MKTLDSFSRRNFLRTAGATLVAAPALSRAANSTADEPNKRAVRIGSPVFFSEDDPVAWARAAREQRNRAVYAPNVSLGDAARVRAFANAAEENDLVIAEVGRWCNMMDADATRRAENIKNVTEGLALADELGAKCCVDIAGSFHPDIWYGPHPRNVTEEFFDLAVENARKIVDGVNPRRAVFAYEMMGWAFPNSVESCLRLVKAVDRRGFGVHLDVCNLINTPDKFWNTTSLIEEAFAKLGPWIASCHAKDLKWTTEMNIHFEECVIGEGTTDFKTYLRCLARLDHDVPLMIEHMANQEQYERCKTKLFEVANESGVALEWVT